MGNCLAKSKDRKKQYANGAPNDGQHIDHEKGADE